MSDTGPLSDHEIAQALVTLPANWTVVRACQELVVLRRMRDVVRELIAGGRLDLDTKHRLEELIS